MNALASSTGGEVHVGQLDDEGCIVYLHRVRSRRRLQARNWFGLRIAAHRTGCGRAALSAVEPERAREVVLRQGLPVDRVERLLDELEFVRRTGAVMTTTFRTGLVSVSAPVVAPNDRVIGGLSTADRRETMTRTRVATLGPAVRDAANAVSRQLVGHARVV